jgi:UDP-glucose 4-epimerase
MSERQKCVVLGGSGFLGQTLCRQLVHAGYRVSSITRSGRPRNQFEKWHTEVEWISASIDSDSAIRALDGSNVIYHLASTTYPSTSNLDMSSDLKSNTLATLRVLQAAANLRVDKLVFVSSGGTVYGIPQQNPIRETHPTDPICSYGIHKLAIEKYLHLFRHLYGLKSAVLRVSNIYGENQGCAKPLGAVAHFTSRIFEDKPIEVWGDGSVVRDYVHVDDVARALITAATYSGSHHIFNIGSGRGTSLNDLLKLLKKHTLLPVNVVYRPGRAFDVAENILDIRLASQELNWQPLIDLEEGLKKVLHKNLSTR